MPGTFASLRSAWLPLLVTAVLAGDLLVPVTAEAQSLSRNRFRGGALVMAAFEPVVEDASNATVRIKHEDKDAALGLIVGSDGYVLTKASRLGEGAITVHTRDDLDFEAEIVGVHVGTDLAMLKIDGRNLTPVEWAGNEDPRVGNWIVTPGPQKKPVAVGVVSVKRRRIANARGVLGIQIEEGEPGPRITQVFPDSGAEKAGLQIGDRVSKVGNKQTATRQTLVQTLGSHGPGEVVKLVVHRVNDKDVLEEFTLEVTLGYPFTNLLNRGEMQNQMGGDLSKRRGGFEAALQHDTYLAPENCGGPLVNLAGKVVGVNIARAGRTESYAIPTSEVRKILDDLKSGKLAPPKPEPVETKTDDTEKPKKAA